MVVIMSNYHKKWEWERRLVTSLLRVSGTLGRIRVIVSVFIRKNSRRRGGEA